MADSPPYPGAPRWVKVSAIIGIVALLLFVALQLSGVLGRHGPGLHARPEDDRVDGEHTPANDRRR